MNANTSGGPCSCGEAGGGGAGGGTRRDGDAALRLPAPCLAAGRAWWRPRATDSGVTVEVELPEPVETPVTEEKSEVSEGEAGFLRMGGPLRARGARSAFMAGTTAGVGRGSGRGSGGL